MTDDEPGVTAGWLYIYAGTPEVGQRVTAIPVARLVDPDGTEHRVPTGDSRAVTVVAG